MDKCKNIMYEKLYMSFVQPSYPVIRTIKVSDGKLTDIKVDIVYAEFYNSDPQGFVSAIAYTMKNLNKYLGKPYPSITIRLDKGDKFVAGTFVEG